MLLNNKKIRVIGLASFLIFLLIILFRTHSSRLSTLDVPSAVAEPPKSLENNKLSSLDEGIKSKVGKISDGDEESVIKAIEDSKKASKGDSNPDDSLTQDKSTPGEKFDPSKELLEIRLMSPMVVFSKTYCPYSKKLKKLLKDNYQITPEFLVVELDKHAHGAELQEYLGEVSGRSTVPNVIIGKTVKSRGGFDDFNEYHNLGKLMNYLSEWGGKGLNVQRGETPSNL